MNLVTEEQMKTIKSSFRAMDENGDGKISVAEFRKAAKKLGQVVSVAEVKAMFREVDDNGDGFLDYKEYEAMMLERMEATAMEDKYLTEMFTAMDVNKDGKISYKEISKVMGISKEEAKQMVQEADSNGDGEISYEEFVAIYRCEQGS